MYLYFSLFSILQEFDVYAVIYMYIKLLCLLKLTF